MKVRFFKAFTILLAAGIFLASCGGGSQNESQASDSSDFDAATEQIISEIDQVIKDLPPPSEVPYL